MPKKYVRVKPPTKEDLLRETAASREELDQLTDHDLENMARYIERHFNADGLWNEAEYWIYQILQEKERGHHD